MNRAAPDASGRRLLLVSANRERYPDRVFPTGSAYVAGAARRARAEVRVFDAACHLRPATALAREVRRFHPDVVGFSLRNVDSASWPRWRSYLPGYRLLVDAVRAAGSARVVLGGAGFALFPEQFLAALGADAGIVGDGEAGILEALTGPVSGVCDAALPHLDDVGYPPDMDQLFPRLSRYGTVGIQTARGCPHRCVYCSYRTLEGDRVRTRPPRQVVDEMRRLHRDHGRTGFFIVDSSFGASEPHMVQVLEEILRQQLAIRFSCYLEPRVRSREVVALLARAGCHSVDFGTDSGSPSVLAELNKGFEVADVVRTSELCRAAGLKVCQSLIFGSPGESDATIEETIRLMERLRPNAVIATMGIRIFPDTELRPRAEREGVIAPGDDLFEPRFYFGGLEPEAMYRRIQQRVSGQNHWIFPGAKDWSHSPLIWLLQQVHRRGPLWEVMRGKHSRQRVTAPGPPPA